MDFKTKKGFLFVITVFLILTYILLSISVWVQALEASERSYSELYKESTVELIIDQLTPVKVNEISNVVMTRGVFVLNRYAVDHTVKEGTEYEHEHIEAALGEYIKDGTMSDEHFNDGIGPESEYNASLGGWMANLNVSLLAIGAYIDDFEIYDFRFEQNDIDSLNYSFRMRVSMKDTSGTTSISRTYDVDGIVNITGFVDPAIIRETDAIDNPVYRQFFFHSRYASPTDLGADELEGISAGQGWFYGPIIDVSGAVGLETEHRHRYIIAGSYDDISSLSEETRNMYGGFIVTTEPSAGTTCTEIGGSTFESETETFNAIYYELSGSSCDVAMDMDTYTFKPYVIASGFDSGDAPECPDLIRGTTEKCVLIIAEHGPDYIVERASHYDDKFDTANSGIYGIEDLRDYTLCGYYVHDENSPSYLQRLLNNSYGRTSTDYGIETFLIGEYMNPAVYDDYDRLDQRMFEMTLLDYLIRGMPGCKSAGMCTASGVTVGHFGLADETIGEYSLGDIDCAEGAGCD